MMQAQGGYYTANTHMLVTCWQHDFLSTRKEKTAANTLARSFLKIYPLFQYESRELKFDHYLSTKYFSFLLTIYYTFF